MERMIAVTARIEMRRSLRFFIIYGVLDVFTDPLRFARPPNSGGQFLGVGIFLCFLRVFLIRLTKIDLQRY